MSKTALRRYAPLYIALAVTAVVMAFLFLRPDSALGLTVDVDAQAKFEGFAAAVPLNQPQIIEVEINLPEGEFQAITSATLGIVQNTGSAGFIDFGASGDPAVVIPLPSGNQSIVFEDLSDQLPVSGDGNTLGSLFVDVELVSTIADAFGYGYGYRGGQGGGKITISLSYTPPSLAGLYVATVDVLSNVGADTVLASSQTQFSVLDPIPAGAVTVLSTMYPRSNTQALSRDLVVLRADVSDDILGNVVSLTANPGLLSPSSDTMIPTSDFHPAIVAKWGVDASNSNYILPIQIKPQVPQPEQLTCDSCPVTLTLVDIAGQELVLSDAAGASVKVSNSRDEFNIYVMPGINFLSTPLQCSDDGSSECNTDFEFVLDEFLKQTAVNADNAPDTGGDVIEIVWYYCADGSTICPTTGGAPQFVSYVPGRTSNPLENLAAGPGYIAIVDDAAFQTVTDTSVDAQFAGALPVPIRLTFEGAVFAEGGEFILPGLEVREIWNLIGLHSERDSTVAAMVNNVQFPERLWKQVFAFNNDLEILLDSDGQVVRDPLTDKPLLALQQGNFKNLIEFEEPVLAGGGFWLEMCEDVEKPTCNNVIGPVQEPR